MPKNIVAIHQPNLFPRLKVLQKIYQSNKYVCYDDVQYVRNDWQNRVFIRNYKDKNLFWINIPVNKPFGQKSRINEVMISDKDENISFLNKQILHAYSKAPFWPEMTEYLKSVFTKCLEDDDNTLNNFLNIALDDIIQLVCPDTKMVRSSQMNYVFSKDKNLHLIEICKYCGGKSYICGSGGLSYVDENVFKENGISLIIQNWNEERIRSRYENVEWKNVSFLDFWARYGLEELKKVLGGNLE